LASEIERLAALEDEPDNGSELLAAMGATRVARNRLKKLEAKIAETRERLAFAKDATRAKRRAQLQAVVIAEGREFLAKARATQQALFRVIAAREELQAAGFHREYASLPVLPAINGSALLAADLLSNFEASLQPAAANPVRPGSAAPAPRISGALSSPPGPQPSPLRRPASDTGAALPVVENTRPLHREIAAEGEVLVRLVRPGLELSDGTPGMTGDVISVPEAQAREIMRNGAGDLVTASDLAQPDAGSEPAKEAAE
jgi:hypothetical protein